ncbi:kinase-like protein, partial [Rickenella mellea]
KIIHGDLRAANILIDSRRNARLTDFGISTMTRNDTKVCHAETVTNVRWLAYELVGIPRWEARDRVNEQTDMFAFGCVMHEVLTKLPPFHDEDEEDVMTAKKRRGLPPYPDRVHGDVWQAMVKFWNIDPSTRPTAERAHVMMDELVRSLPDS